MQVDETFLIVYSGNNVEAISLLLAVEGSCNLPRASWSLLKVDMTPINEPTTVWDSMDRFDTGFEVKALVQGGPVNIHMKVLSYGLDRAICPHLHSPLCKDIRSINKMYREQTRDAKQTCFCSEFISMRYPMDEESKLIHRRSLGTSASCFEDCIATESSKKLSKLR